MKLYITDDLYATNQLNKSGRLYEGNTPKNIDKIVAELNEIATTVRATPNEMSEFYKKNLKVH